MACGLNSDTAYHKKARKSRGIGPALAEISQYHIIYSAVDSICRGKLNKKFDLIYAFFTRINLKLKRH